MLTENLHLPIKEALFTIFELFISINCKFFILSIICLIIEVSFNAGNNKPLFENVLDVIMVIINSDN